MNNNLFDKWPRREFLKTSAATTLGLVLSRWPAMAGPFTREDFDHLVPADKKLAPEWVKSLFARGEPEVLRGRELKFVGMPVGGLCGGQLYLGGDGRLWCWDIFNHEVHTGDGTYAHPVNPTSPLAQKFALKIGDSTHTLDRDGFSNISFRGEYPVGIVKYIDPALPAEVTLEAFSPFIPLNTEDSSLPATILEFTVKNSSAEKIHAEISGCLENVIGLQGATKHIGTRRNQVARHGKLLRLDCAATETNPGEKPFANEADFGTMSLALLDADRHDRGNPSVSLDDIFAPAETKDSSSASVPLKEKLIGALSRKFELKPGASAKITFVLAWHFPNLSLPKLGAVGRHYANRFNSSGAVADYVALNHARLAAQTKLWRDTWYDSTLPYWFLDRTFLNTSTLATSTSHRFANGRYYGWEGVGCCEGTCGHVYHYAHATARLFPDLERYAREHVDFGLAQQPDGDIHFRGEFNGFPAIDGQSGTILRALREHQMSADTVFLRSNWPNIRRAVQWLISKDGDNDGLIESNQHNTLDSDWFGKVAWLSGLYQAALRGAAEMAEEVGDSDFAAICRTIFETGRKNLVDQLFDGEYFINRVDPKHLDAINSGTGCEIDQVFGQSWAFQVGLPRVIPEKETLSALKSLWHYNFTPDVGPYREAYKSGRWYAMPGEAGLLMCTFPRRDWDFTKASGKGPGVFAGYFNECMNGFEHQVAGHMIWEGMLLEGLAVERALHDRYHALRRNPWNEVECGDHYARSMASYGVFLASCGFEYHGPKQHIGFAPRLTPENFKCAFTSAEGWGAYSQKIDAGKLEANLTVHWGKLKLQSLSLEHTEGSAVQVFAGTKAVAATLDRTGKRLLITLAQPMELSSGQQVGISII